MAEVITDKIAKDFDSILESLLEFSKVEYGPQAQENRKWSDFNISSFSRNWAELLAYMGDQLNFYLDVQANESYLETATVPAFIIRLAQQNGFEPPTQQASSGKVTFTTSGPYTIEFGTRLSTGNGVEFFTTRQILGNVSEEIQVEVIQGTQFTESFEAEGIQNEEFITIEAGVIVDLENVNAALRSPIVTVNGEGYSIVSTPIESGPIDKSVTREILADGRTKLTFGDGVFGRRLNPNERIEVVYRTGGGTVGNIAAGQIEALVDTINNIDSVTNSDNITGGADQLGIEEIRARVPLAIKTTAGAVNIQDYGEILIANFPQVLDAQSSINTVDEGIDIDVYVLPQADVITDITDNSILSDTLTEFLDNKKVVGAQFLIKNAEGITVNLEIEATITRDASRAKVVADITEAIKAYYNLRTGGPDSVGISFKETIQLSTIFDILNEVPEIKNFDVKKHTLNPRFQESKASPNQTFFKSEIDVFEGVNENEWLVVASEDSNPEPIDGQVDYTVHKRSLATITSLTEGSITDSNVDLTVKQGEAIVINDTTLTDPVNVFKLGEFDSYIVVDSSNNLWQVQETKSKSLIISSPALNDASVTSVANGSYSIVKNFSGAKIAISGLIFSVLYNNKNTFFSPGSSFDIIATIRTDFWINEEQTNKGTFGVPVGLSTVTPQGANAGDLVDITFAGNPKLANVSTDFVLVDRTGNSFEIVNVSDNEESVTDYNNELDLDTELILDDSVQQSIVMPIVAEQDVVSTLLTAGFRLKRDLNPLGSIQVDIHEDNAGSVGTLLASSDLISAALIDSANFAQIEFPFPTELSLTKDSKYYLVVKGDNAYKLSFAANDGHIEVGIDTSTLGYHPATTSQGTVTLDGNSDVNVLKASSNNLTVIDNNIRSQIQARGTIKIVDNDFTGTNQVTIAGVGFVEGIQFNVGATTSDTRDNLLAVIQTDLVGVVTATALGTETIEMIADLTNYPGELGNVLTIESIDPTPINFELSGSVFGGGLDGDRITYDIPVHLNDSLVDYSYNSVNGEITFVVAVGLPSFSSGMIFTDGVNAEFEILGIVGDVITITPGLTVDSTIGDKFSGSIRNSLLLEFGVDGLAAGIIVDDTAEAIKVYLESKVSSLSIVRTGNELEVTIGERGNQGNSYKVEVEDLGSPNFELSSPDFTGGQDSDVIEVNGDFYKAVTGTPNLSLNEFSVGGTSTDTIASLSDSVNFTGTVLGTAIGNILVVSSLIPGAVGNSITLSVEQELNVFTLSGSVLTGGQDNFRVLLYDGAIYTENPVDSEAIFKLVFSTDNLVIVSKSDAGGNQILPVISVDNQIDSALGKRYYSDDSELSFLIATLTPNSFITGASNASLYGKGSIGGNDNVRLDQFVFRTSGFRDDIDNLRDMEIIGVTDETLSINLLGGVD